jgi:hypothetical protein
MTASYRIHAVDAGGRRGAALIEARSLARARQVCFQALKGGFEGRLEIVRAPDGRHKAFYPPRRAGRAK